MLSPSGEKSLHRLPHSDAELECLNEERDHVAIQVNLAWDETPTDLVRLAQLQRKLAKLESRISKHRHAES